MISGADRERFSKIRALLSQGVKVSPDDLKWYRESGKKVRATNGHMLVRAAWPRLGTKVNPRHIEQRDRAQCA